MAERKTERQFVYQGLGFPVTLINVPMLKVRGTWTPQIDHNLLMKNVLLLLVNSPSRLTGNQIRFIRHYFEMSLERFGEQFDVSHAAVIKWEKAGDKAPPIKWPIEKDIRLFILDEQKSNAGMFKEAYRNLREKKEVCNVAVTLHFTAP